MKHARNAVSWRRRFGLVTVAGGTAVALLAGGYAAAAPGDECRDGHGKSDQSAHCTGNKGDGDDENGGGGDPSPVPDPQSIIDTVTGLLPDAPDPTTLIPAPPSDLPDPSSLLPGGVPDPTTLIPAPPSDLPDPTTLLPSPPAAPDPQQVIDTVTGLVPTPPV